MIKNFLFVIFAFFVVLNPAIAQDAKSIIKQSQLKASEINTCSYLIYTKIKVTGMRDTLYQTGRCTFVKIEQDTILRKHICTDNFSGIKEIYNGDFYFKSRRTDSTVYIWDANRFNFYVHQFATNPMAYSPLVNKKNIFSRLANDSESVLTLSNDTIMNESLCYHIKSFTRKLKDNKETGITISADLFIRKSDFIPMGHIQNMESNFSKAINNYESAFLEELEINTPIDEYIFSLSNVPDNYTFKQEGVVNIKNYIVAQEQIPDFDYNYIKSDSLYSKVKGKSVLVAVIVLGNCLPCRSAIIMIEDIYQKYKKKNLSLIIVSPNGWSENNHNLMNDTVSPLPTLSNAQQIIDKTRISVFPTIYLFNKKGEQLYKNEGFNNLMQKELENEIDAMHLN